MIQIHTQTHIFYGVKIRKLIDELKKNKFLPATLSAILDCRADI